MVDIYKTIDGQMTEQSEITPDCWINVINPTAEEINELVETLGVEQDFLLAPLDEEETSRIESEGDQTLMIIDVPFTRQENKLVIFETIPVGIIITKDHVITVCLRDSIILRDFAEGKVKQVHTYMKTRFLLQILYRVATRFLQNLRQIDKISSNVEKQLHLSMRNKELIQLLDLEKSLVFFSTSLKSNEVTLEKTMRGRFIKMYEDDQDLLEDVLIEVKQAIEMSNIYSNILSGTMDAFASIISNNLNIVMKVMTSITVLMAIPTMIASFYGMNVGGTIPFPNFWFVVLLSLGITAIAWYILYKKKMF